MLGEGTHWSRAFDASPRPTTFLRSLGLRKLQARRLVKSFALASSQVPGDGESHLLTGSHALSNQAQNDALTRSEFGPAIARKGEEGNDLTMGLGADSPTRKEAMKWSWKIGEVSGIGVYVHATFLILIGWVALNHWVEARNLAHVVAGVGFILCLFACVVLHEFGHALTAKKYGIKTRDITLLPIGGLARLERMPSDPKQELWVALAGPAVNVVIAAGIFVFLQFTGGTEPLSRLSVIGGSFFHRLWVVNVFLVLFNLLPAFPMDGGRVARALLAMRMDYMRATQIAANLGQGMALVFGFIGLFSNPFLVFVALFVWIGAAQESNLVQVRTALGGVPVSRAMVRDFRTLSPTDSLSRAVELILAGAQQDFPVTEDGQAVGLLTRGRLLVALAQKGPETSVGEVMERDFQVVDSSDMLETAFARLQNCQCPMLPVERKRQLVGLVTTENVGEFIMIQGALGGARGASSKERSVSSVDETLV